MHAIIKFVLSPKGQKASILTGGNGQRCQELQIPQDDPYFRAAVEAGSIDMKGNVVVDLGSYNLERYAIEWDEVPTAVELLAERKQREIELEREKDRKTAAIKESTLAVLRERRCTWTQLGCQEIRYATADWPWPADQSVMDSPEAQAWLAELATAKNLAEAARKEKDEQQAAERQAAKEEATRKEKERREALGLGEGDDDFRIENGALAQIPVWQNHKRGKNWLATIAANPKAPGGLERDFAEKAKGELFYLLPDLEIGQAVEFGADYYSGSGRKSADRWYGYVVRVEADYLVLHKCDTGKQAIKQGEAHAKNSPPSEVESAIARVNGEGAIVN